jgi:hypothetical protein
MLVFPIRYPAATVGRARPSQRNPLEALPDVPTLKGFDLEMLRLNLETSGKILWTIGCLAHPIDHGLVNYGRCLIIRN